MAKFLLTVLVMFSVAILAAVVEAGEEETLSMIVDEEKGGGEEDEEEETLSKIIGGSEVDIQKVPWQVSLQTAGGQHFCGGSIISNRWVLTAAHCTWRRSPKDLRIHVGSSYIDSRGKLYQIEKIVIHEYYDGDLVLNDISAMKTSSTISFKAGVGKVRLPKLGASRPPVGTTLLVSGWGYTEYRSVASHLKAVQVQLREYDECRHSFTMTDESTQICAGSQFRKFCDGDSGGPLVLKDILVGIVSYGNGPCTSTVDGYTDVAAFRRWIKTHTGI